MLELDALLTIEKVQSPVHAPKRGDASRRNGQLVRGLRCRSGEALQRQEAHDHLQAVAKPVIEFLRHQVLLQGQNAHLAEEVFLA